MNTPSEIPAPNTRAFCLLGTTVVIEAGIGMEDT